MQENSVSVPFSQTPWNEWKWGYKECPKVLV